MHFSDVECGKRLFLGTGRPIALGIGQNEIRGSAYLEGPVQMGTADAFSSVLGTLMIARDKNTDEKSNPPRTLWVKGNSRFEGDNGTPNALNITGNTVQIGDTDTTGYVNITGNGAVSGNWTIGGTMSAGFATWSGSIVATTKLFDIKHPTKEGYRLAHACLEGPENAVYVRGRLKNDKIILLPEYWRNLVDIDTISVQSYKSLLKNNTVLGYEIQRDNLICNAIMLTSQKSPFFKLWLHNYEKEFNPDGWGEASIHLPGKINKEYPNLALVLPEKAFFRPYATEGKDIFEKNININEELITLHLWESFTINYMKEIKNFEWIKKNKDTLYSKIVFANIKESDI